jgi:hypothetical protein
MLLDAFADVDDGIPTGNCPIFLYFVSAPGALLIIFAGGGGVNGALIPTGELLDAPNVPLNAVGHFLTELPVIFPELYSNEGLKADVFRSNESLRVVKPVFS